jgi:hypothetical protein
MSNASLPQLLKPERFGRRLTNIPQNAPIPVTAAESVHFRCHRHVGPPGAVHPLWLIADEGTNAFAFTVIIFRSLFFRASKVTSSDTLK